MGNLGNAIAKAVKHSDEFNLVAIFSKRNIEGTVHFDKILEYSGKIDLLFLCGGSQNELEGQAEYLLPHFNIVESYDNHKRLKTHIEKLNILAGRHRKLAFCSVGWDPGLFSLMRGLFDALGYKPYSLWGKGTSQGHTQAIKQVPNVIDAIQFTLPNITAIEKIKRGESVDGGKRLHSRECYVVAEPVHQKEIEQQILTMPDYFEGYKTSVHFVNQKKLDSLKSFSHKGQVLTENNTLNFSLNLSSNPDFTASVMVAFARAYSSLKIKKGYGAYTIFDMPFRYLLKQDKYFYL